jgi:hypothetical protein
MGNLLRGISAWGISIIALIILVIFLWKSIKIEAKKVFSRRGTFPEKKKKEKKKVSTDDGAGDTENKGK